MGRGMWVKLEGLWRSQETQSLYSVWEGESFVESGRVVSGAYGNTRLLVRLVEGVPAMGPPLFAVLPKRPYTIFPIDFHLVNARDETGEVCYAWLLEQAVVTVYGEEEWRLYTEKMVQGLVQDIVRRGM